MKKSIHHLILVALAGVATAPEAFAKKSDKKRDTKTTAAAGSHTTKETKAVPVVKSKDMTSLQNTNVKSMTIESSPSEALQGSTSGAVLRGSQVQVERTGKTVDETRKSIRGLGLGLFRSEHLASGVVMAPGVADFAAYARSSALNAVAKPGDQNKETTALTNSRLGETSSSELAKQAEAEKLRLQTLESINQILKTKPPADSRFALMMRVAELEVERHTYFLELEIKEFNDTHARWKETQKGAEPKFSTKRSNAHLLSGIDILRKLVNEFPDHARAPEALYNLGFLLTQSSNESAVLYFERLIKRFPKSEFIPDAQLALGEFYFSRTKFEKAQTYYQKVLNHKDSNAYNYAVYKLGWTYYNLGAGRGKDDKLLAKSLAAFKLVVKLGEVAKENSVKGLRQDALKDMVVVFAEIGDIFAAQRYFESLGEPELYVTMLERLAWQNAEAGQNDKAVSLYERLVAEGGTHPRLPTFYSKIPELLEKQNKRQRTLTILANMSAALANNSKWMQANQANKEAMEERNKVLSRDLIAWAQRMHLEAQKSKKEKSYDEALQVYNMYLDHYGEAAVSYSAHFYKAEILVQKSKYVEASDEYFKTVAIDEKFNIGGKFTRDAIVNSIACVDAVLAKTPEVKLPPAGKVPQKIPLTALHARLVKGLDLYVKTLPNEKDSLKIAHRAASIVYSFGDYESANIRWTALTQRNPRSTEAYDGARLVLKVFVERQQWETAISESRKFLKIQGVADTKLSADLTVVLKGSIFQYALALERENKRAEAADMFLAYHREFQDDVEAPKALFNAANNKFRIGKMDEAVSALRIILAQYPTSNLTANSLYLIASSFDAVGDFASSASSYEQFAADLPKHESTPEALLRAAEQRVAVGDNAQAIKDASHLVEAYAFNAKSVYGWEVIGKAYDKMGEHASAAKFYLKGAETVKAKNPAIAVNLYGLASDAALRSQSTAQAQNNSQTGLAFVQAIPEGKRTPEMQDGIRQIGLTQLALLDTQVAAVYKMSVTNAKELNAQFAKIRDEVQRLAGKYVTVAKLGNAESGVGALYRLAEMQEFLGATLMKAPVPAGAKQEEIETFKSSLERIALPLQEEAGNLYLTAWQKAKETEAISPVYTKKIYDKLVILRPAEFKPAVEDMPAPGYFTSDLAVLDQTKRIVKD